VWGIRLRLYTRVEGKAFRRKGGVVSGTKFSRKEGFEQLVYGGKALRGGRAALLFFWKRKKEIPPQLGKKKSAQHLGKTGEIDDNPRGGPLFWGKDRVVEAGEGMSGPSSKREKREPFLASGGEDFFL